MVVRALICAILLFSVYSFSEDVVKVEATAKPKFMVPQLPKDAILGLHFDSSKDMDKLILSTAKKDGVEEAISKYDGLWAIEVPDTSALQEDYHLILKSKNKHHAIAADLGRDFKFINDEFVLQYEVNFLEGISCGGAYVKLISSSPNLNLLHFHDKTPYTIMFGPDKCGSDMKLHFIFRHTNPISGVVEEKHAKQPTQSLDSYFSDKKTHLYTLVIRFDNTFEIFVDQNLINSGSLLSDVKPPVNPPAEINDPNDTKPSSWDDREKITDPNAKKPDDWDETAPEFVIDDNAVMPEGWLVDEPLLIPDPEGEMPEDWDAETDGDWEPAKVDNPACKSAPGCGEWKKPLVKNPKYKGKWSAPMISNPEYKGQWTAKKIPNPDYFEDNEPYKMTPIRALGLELWSLSDQIAFDNFYIGTSKRGADEYASQTWIVKHAAELAADPSAKSIVDGMRDLISEKPWVIAVAVTAILLPVALICFFCCRSSPSDDDPSTAAAQYKKTDAPVPDDDVCGEHSPTEEGEEEEGEGVEEDEDEEEEHGELPKEESEEDEDFKTTTRQRTRKE